MIKDIYRYQILFEELRSRTARLERLVRFLFVAVVVLSALAMAGDFGGTGTTTEATPQSTVSPHGSYCLSDQGTVYLSSLGSDGPTYRQFERLCESGGGEVLWRP